MEILDKFSEIVTRLIADAREGALILVEGTRDEAVLRQLGLDGKIIKYSEIGRIRAVEQIGRGSKVIILTDYDAEGERILREIEAHIYGDGVKVDTVMRTRLFETVRPYANSLEGLASMVDEVARRIFIQGESWAEDSKG